MKKILFLWVVLFAFTSAQSQNTVHHRAKIYYDQPAQLQQLELAGVPMDHGLKKKNVFIESDFSEEEIETAKAMGFKVEITITDVKSFYLNRNNPNHPAYVGYSENRNATCETSNATYQTPSNFNVFPANQYGGFYTYSQLLQELDDMAALYPNLITAKADIGPNGNPFTTEGTPDNSTNPPIGGNTIKWVKISDNPNSSAEGEPQVLYTSIHHAREPASLSQLVFFMWYLLENYNTDDEIKTIVDNTELYFVPVVNPDGYLYNEKTDPQGGGFWRKNRKNTYGVDNNRNYNYYINGNSNNGTWSGPGSSSNTNSDLYHGSAPFSEAENQAIKWFVEQHDFVLALNNHTFGELLYHPFGYADVATPEEDLFKEITGLMVSQNNYTNLRDYPFSGDSDDFMYGTVGTHNKIYAMTPEVGDSFWPAASSIEAICKDMMFLNLTAANLVGNYATIEDTHSNFITSTTENINYSIKRLGLQDPANFTVSINPISSNITSVGSANSHNGLNFNEVVSGTISLTLDASIMVGDQVEYELIVNNGLYDRKLIVNKLFGQPAVVLNEPGNTTNTNWTTSGWSSTNEDFVSASSSITDSPNSNYSSNENSSITLTNPIDLSGAVGATLNFQAKWDIENNWDYVQVEVSTNNGSTWIPQCGKYTNDGVPNQSGANGEPLYDGIQNDWVSESIDLSDYLGETILIRFKLVTDNALNRDGFYFDDLTVSILDPNLSTVEFDVINTSLFPNPVTEALTIKTQIQDFTVSIYNLQGQLVFRSSTLNGNSIIDFSGFSYGLYLLSLETENTTKTYKVIKR